ncbi:MAG TPA: hypothetical protein VHO23_02950 [Candidatus Paceibacterota bacterium]|nr:hypothetical protein [Candidatus Paceibacterota bacterium]
MAYYRPRRALIARAIERQEELHGGSLVPLGGIEGINIDSAFMLIRIANRQREAKDARKEAYRLHELVAEVVARAGFDTARTTVYRRIVMQYYSFLSAYAKSLRARAKRRQARHPRLAA